jgi:hypothetical protein
MIAGPIELDLMEPGLNRPAAGGRLIGLEFVRLNRPVGTLLKSVRGG